MLTDGNGAEGAHWFPGSELNYVDHVLRQPAGDLALIAVDEAGSRQRAHLRRADGAGRSRRRRPVGAWGVGSATGSPPCCRTESGRRCLPRSGQPRGRLVGLRARVRGGQHGGPLPADPPERADHRDGLPLRRHGLPARLENGGAGVGASTTSGRSSKVPYRPVPAGDASRPGGEVLGAFRLSWAELLAEPAAARAGRPWRSSTRLWILYSSGTTGLPKPIVHGHGGIVLEHVKAGTPPQRLRAGQPGVLVQHDRLDDVELPRRRAADRADDRLLRREPGVSRPDGAVAHGGARRRHVLRHERSVHRGVPQSPGCRPATRSDFPAMHSSARPVHPCRRRDSAGRSTAIGDDVLVGSVSGAATCARASCMPSPLLPVSRRRVAVRGPRVRRRGVRSGGQARRRGSRRARGDDGDAVDAGGFLGRRRREPPARQLFRRLPRRLATRRLGEADGT